VWSVTKSDYSWCSKDVDTTARSRSCQTSATLQPDMPWGDWCHKCVCDISAAPVRSTRDSLVTKYLWRTLLQRLHWLPVCQCVQFKIAVLVYKALHNLLSAYLVEDCQLVCHWRPTTVFVGHRHVLSAANQHVLAIAPSLLRMKQSANPATRVGHYTRTILTSTQNAFIW